MDDQADGRAGVKTHLYYVSFRWEKADGTSGFAAQNIEAEKEIETQADLVDLAVGFARVNGFSSVLILGVIPLASATIQVAKSIPTTLRFPGGN
jgi:hypothetical protein